MGACAMLPRIGGQGRASELLYTGRALGGEEAERWGFLNRLVDPDRLDDEAMALAKDVVAGRWKAQGKALTSDAAPLARVAAQGKRLPVGIELYSVRDELAKDNDATLTAIASGPSGAHLGRRDGIPARRRR